jgi:hypothetical protein
VYSIDRRDCDANASKRRSNRFDDDLFVFVLSFTLRLVFLSVMYEQNVQTWAESSS